MKHTCSGKEESGIATVDPLWQLKALSQMPNGIYCHLYCHSSLLEEFNKCASE